MLSQPGKNHCIAVFVLSLLLSACSGNTKRPTPGEAPISRTPVTVTTSREKKRTTGESAAIIALGQIGVPYRYGGSNTSGFDCSGLVNYAYSVVGKGMPRTTSGLWQELRPVSPEDLRVGDILFFDIAGKVSHVGLYIGDQRFVHAPSTGKLVSVARLDDAYYRRALIRGGRPR